MGTRLEIPIFGPASAKVAVSAGASRIELNAKGSYPAGGLTPSIEELVALEDLQVPIRVMIRPRGPPDSGSKDFIYSDTELQAMVISIQNFKSSGCLKKERGDGFVFGVLRWNKNPDTTTGSSDSQLVLDAGSCRRLIDAARPYKIVFHRAFDELVPTSESLPAIETLVACGVDGILTSGGPGNAAGNIDELGHIIEKAGGRIEIIVGGGVRSSNVRQLTQQLPILRQREQEHWVHSSCLTKPATDTVDEKEISAILEGLS